MCKDKMEKIRLMNVEGGVCQGSALSPFLFIIIAVDGIQKDVKARMCNTGRVYYYRITWLFRVTMMMKSEKFGPLE